MVRLAFALPADEPLPDAGQFYQWLAPHPDSTAAQWMMNYVRTYQRAGAVLARPPGRNIEFSRNRLTPLGWWIFAGMLISLFPPYTRTVGVWMITILAAMIPTFLVGIENERYFLPAWPLLILLLGIAIDVPFRLIRRSCHSSPGGGLVRPVGCM